MYIRPSERLRNLPLRDWPVADIEAELRKRKYEYQKAEEDLARVSEALEFAMERESSG